MPWFPVSSGLQLRLSSYLTGVLRKLNPWSLQSADIVLDSSASDPTDGHQDSSGSDPTNLPPEPRCISIHILYVEFVCQRTLIIF